jgi:hypothetical protein
MTNTTVNNSLSCKVRRTSRFTGKETTLELPVHEARVHIWLNTASRERPLIQEAFPELTAAEREFLKTGYTVSDWVKIFNEIECAKCKATGRLADGTPCADCEGHGCIERPED